jgi:hypothetical protein
MRWIGGTIHLYYFKEPFVPNLISAGLLVRVLASQVSGVDFIFLDRLEYYFSIYQGKVKQPEGKH